MKILAIIPARGGSKGIPRKNVRLLAGKPLIAHTIQQAQEAEAVDRIVVSTDDVEIAEISRRYGAEVIWRPAEISGDLASSEDALLHVLRSLDRSEAYRPEYVVFLQCTSPLTRSQDIDGTIQAMLQQNADSALSVTPFHYFLWQQDDMGDSVGINHDKSVRLMRQQRETQYRETGAVYAMRTEGFIRARHRFFGKTVMYVMPPERCLEIDDPVDFEVAEVLMRSQLSTTGLLPPNVAALVLDFDGVFTDNRVWVMEDGREAVVCSRSDGMGLSQLINYDVCVLVLSSERNAVVKARCEKLGVPYAYGVDDKWSYLLDWLREKSIELSDVVYVGNDVNDLTCLQGVGCGVVVSDAHPKVIPAARIVLSAPGGNGAIREIIELIMSKLIGDQHASSR